MAWWCFASVTPGLEESLAAELSELGVEGRTETGGVLFQAELPVLYRVQLRSRVAARVTVRVGRFRADQYDALATRVRQLPWKRFVHPRQPLVVRATSHQSRLRHRDAVERKVSLAIGDSLKGPRLPGPRPPREPALVVVRAVKDMVDISVDASGDGLHRRGWRKATGRAPIRENLAAGILWRAGWRPGEPLVDPMCGSGTFAIEAACWARGLAPGRGRSFACERWPTHDRKAWQREVSRAGGGRVRTPILAADRSGEAVRDAQSNARRAGIHDDVSWEVSTASKLEPPGRLGEGGKPGLVVVNPPYGKRLETGKASRVYRDLGRALRAHWRGWRLAVLVPDRRLLGPLGISGLESETQFRNGGVRVSLAVGLIGDDA